MTLLISFFRREVCDLPRHPVAKLNNIIFCPRSLVIIGEITLQPEEGRHNQGFNYTARYKKNCCNGSLAEIKEKKTEWGCFWLDFLKNVLKKINEEVITAVKLALYISE